jgi:hypothetical protein
MFNVTWDEMFTYLSEQENCRVDYNGHIVLDLHKFLDIMADLISCHDPKDRANSIACKSLKGSLHKIYEGHRKGFVEVANSRKVKPFSVYAV